MKRVFLLTAFCIVAFNLNAQRATDEEPYGLRNDFRALVQDVVILEAPDMETIIKEDIEKEKESDVPLRFAVGIKVNFTPENSGVWQNLADGSKIWRLKVNAPGALSTNTRYGKFWLPDGAKFFVYSEDTRQSIGAIISEFLEERRGEPNEFATALVYGENVVYEYYQPVTVKEAPVILISNIGYGYRYVNNPYESTKNFGDAGDCNININCSEGSNWKMEKNAVARVLIPIGDDSFWCSCALVNNTLNNYKPYVLTANHCIEGGYDAEINYDASGMIFYWLYEHPGCANSIVEPNYQRTSTGATVVANNAASDFALLLIYPNQDPRKVSGVIPYYLGWDRSGNATSTGVGIHHPRGDVKKISTYTSTPASVTVNGTTNGYWRVNWYSGTTETGSSGSPLINSNKRVIGQLSNGDASCANPAGYDNYGKFSVSWTGNNSNKNYERLSTWLDPGNTNSQTLDGISAPVPYISGSNTVCSSANYTVPGFQVDNWHLTNTSIFSYTSNNNSATVTVQANKPYSSTILQATVNGLVYTKTIENCAIKGPSSFCLSSEFELTTGPAQWSMTSGSSYFTITPVTGTNRVQVTANPSGKSGTLTAVSGGNTYNLNISTCQAVVAGPPTVCSASSPSTYVLSMGTASYWTASGSVRVVSYNSTSCQVEATAYDGSSGAVIAVFSDGGAAVPAPVTATCIQGSNVVSS